MIKKISKKRKEQLKEYNRIKQELFLNDLKAGKLYCFLSNIRITIPEEMRGYPDDILASMIEVHHINGARENEHLFDPEEMKPVIRTYHSQYHSLQSKALLKLSWYNGYLNRIKISHPELYDKEIRKHEK